MSRWGRAIGRLRLELQIWVIARTGWLLVLILATLALLLAVVAASVHGQSGLRALQAEKELIQQRLRMAQATPKPSANVPPPLGAQLWQALPDDSAASVQAEAIVALARRHGLQVREAAYTLSTHGATRALRAVQVNLPLEGDYGAFRAWTGEVLRAHPNVSLDAMTLARRDQPGRPLAIRVRLSLWHRGAEPDRVAAVAPTVRGELGARP